ncbi:retrovirus-related Pol polyprotein from transposon 412 [Trichonephila clavipes]|nr:retrovirus-related Pol polyprotein from transposon 412 [Trichonephila clavipes]
MEMETHLREDTARRTVNTAQESKGNLANGVLYRKWESDDGKAFRWQLVLPKTTISTVLNELHGSPTGGHFGFMKTLQKVRPLPRSSDANNNILVAIDYFAKWPKAYPISDQEAPTVADNSGQGENFDSEVCKRLCEILGINKTRITALHPQSDGMVERLSRTILNSLSMLGYPMLFGRDLCLLAYLLLSRSPDALLASEEYAEKLQAWIEEMHRHGFREDEDPIRCKGNHTRLPRRRQSVVMESEKSQRTLSEVADQLGRSLHSSIKTE